MSVQNVGAPQHYHTGLGQCGGVFLADGSHLWDLEQGPAFASSETLSLRDCVRLVCVRRLVAAAVHRGAGVSHGGLRRAMENT